MAVLGWTQRTCISGPLNTLHLVLKLGSLEHHIRIKREIFNDNGVITYDHIYIYMKPLLLISKNIIIK